MKIATCAKSHKCADGAVGECGQEKDHFGRHLCRSCMAFFGGGEVIEPLPADPKADSVKADDKRSITESEAPPRVTPMDMCSECYARTATELCPYCWRHVCAECARWYPCSRAEKCGHCGKPMKMGDKSDCFKCKERIHFGCVTCGLNAG